MSELDCNSCADWLHPYLDNELEVERAVRVSQHIEQCGDCRARLAEFRALKDGIRLQAPYYPASELLRTKVTRHKGRVYQWLAPAFSTAALAASIVLYFSIPSPQDMVVDELVSSHVRSLMEQHLTDVVSSDRHTVKPWFTGKLDFSPPVYDFAEQGYPLIGGRLDYIRHQNAAALSYKRNKHIINLFIQPDNAKDSPVQTDFRRGFNIVSWKKDNTAFEAVSDLNKQELVAFAQLFMSQH